MSEFTLRPMAGADAEPVYELAERFFQEAFGHATYYTPAIVADLLTGPGVLPELDAMVIERDGHPVAAAHVTARAPFSETRLGVLIEPELDVTSTHACLRLMCQQFDRAMQPRMATPDASSHAAECIPIPRSMPALGDAAAALGFAAQRQVYSMFIELSGDVPVPTWPEGFTTRSPTLHESDVEAMSLVFGEAFAEHPGDGFGPDEVAHGMTLPTTSLPLSLVVEDGLGPIGAVLTLVEEQGGYIAGLGVLPRARRRGIASAMLRQTFAGLAAQGVSGCRLHVEAIKPDAVALYEQAGMRAESVTDMWLRPTPRRRSAPAAG
jgi:ribosomal protein S18 acetylase RimI-like enzyme